jgi:septal ring-binding cell division protein DamX
MNTLMRAAFLIAGLATAAIGQGIRPSLDSAISNAAALSDRGDSAASRATLDSLSRDGTLTALERGEIAYWRTRVAANAVERERLLNDFAIEHTFSPRLPAVLFELGMLELSHDNRNGAIAHLGRYLSIADSDSSRADASLTLGRLLMERGEISRACAVLESGRGSVPPNAIELRTQFDFSVSRCAGIDTTTAKPAPVTDDSLGSRKSGAFTVQVAAYETKGAADKLASTLRGQGLEARVVGKAKPYRVRVGRYATRAQAEEASRRVDATAKTKSIVVVVGPEER